MYGTTKQMHEILAMTSFKQRSLSLLEWVFGEKTRQQQLSVLILSPCTSAHTEAQPLREVLAKSALRSQITLQQSSDHSK